MSQRFSVELVDAIIEELVMPDCHALAYSSRLFRDRVRHRQFTQVTLKKALPAAELTALMDANPAIANHVKTLWVDAIRSYHLLQLHRFTAVTTLTLNDFDWRAGSQDAGDLNGTKLPRLMEIRWWNCVVDARAFRRIVSSFGTLRRLCMVSTVIEDADTDPDLALDGEISSGITLDELKLEFTSGCDNPKHMRQTMPMLCRLIGAVKYLGIKVDSPEHDGTEVQSLQAFIDQLGPSFEHLCVVDFDPANVNLSCASQLRSVMISEHWRKWTGRVYGSGSFQKMLSTVRSAEMRKIIWNIRGTSIDILKNCDWSSYARVIRHLQTRAGVPVQVVHEIDYTSHDSGASVEWMRRRLVSLPGLEDVKVVKGYGGHMLGLQHVV